MRQIIVFTLVLITVSCVTRKELEHTNDRISRIVDDTLVTTIKKYVEETSMEKKARYISVECSYGGNKVVYEISTGRSYRSYHEFTADYFTTIDDVVVIIWITNGKTIELKDIRNDIDQLMATKGVVLEKEMINYDPPLWTLVRCENEYQLLKKSDIDTFEHLPCEYYLMKDWDSDSISLHRR